jgi:ribosome-associated heat shock protein Hsp15
MSDEDRTWQRLDKFLWHARVMRQRADCARLAAGGLLRINRQPTDKPHARVRVGDVITLALPGGRVKVLEVLVLAARRGPPAEAAGLYRIVPELPSAAGNAALHQVPCSAGEEAAYRHD